MPRGVPKNGVRMTAKRLAMATMHQTQIAKPLIPVIEEPREVVRQRITERFEMLSYLTDAAIDGEVKGCIFSGPPGLGKSFTVEKKLERYDPEGDRTRIVKGFTRATGIYQLLHEMQYPGSVLVFDDCDSAFMDEASINLIKAATDTTDRRIISWRAETKMVGEDGEPLPTRFEFNGSVIFITNLDFEAAIASGSRLAPHMEALASRAFYLDLMMKTRNDYLVRIEQVVSEGMLLSRGISDRTQNEIMQFVEKNRDRLSELSLRMVVKLAILAKTQPQRWKTFAENTMMRRS
jgi:hypothetical protein